MDNSIVDWQPVRRWPRLARVAFLFVATVFCWGLILAAFIEAAAILRSL